MFNMNASFKNIACEHLAGEFVTTNVQWVNNLVYMSVKPTLEWFLYIKYLIYEYFMFDLENPFSVSQSGVFKQNVTLLFQVLITSVNILL